MTRSITTLIAIAALFTLAVPACADEVISGEAYFAGLDPETGQMVEIGRWVMTFDEPLDVNSGQVFCVSGEYSEGPNEDEAGSFEGIYAYDSLNDAWTLDIHARSYTLPGYDWEMRVTSGNHPKAYRGYWFDEDTCAVPPSGGFGTAELFLPGLIREAPENKGKQGK